MRIDFYLRFHTQFGQLLSVGGNIPALGLNELDKPLSLRFFNEEFWHGTIEIDPSEHNSLHYRYVFTNELGAVKKEAEKERVIDLRKNASDIVVIDTWNDESSYENAFFTTPFTDVFFKGGKSKPKKTASSTHQFKVKAPLLSSNECVFIAGNVEELNNWSTEKYLMLQKKGDWWVLDIDLSQTAFPITYKYGIYNSKKEEFVRFEDGDNRTLHYDIPANKRTIIHDGFIRLPNTVWKGAGIAIPVFSLRSNNSFGVGEFADIKLLVDWSKEAGLKLIQILPINDTSATFTWKDSYPYAAISAFALHPVYINLQKVAGKKHAQTIKALAKKQKQLNALAEIDYDQVIKFKTNVLRELYEMDGSSFMKEEGYDAFFEDNKNWLVRYAAFCFYRDKFGTSDFSKWKFASSYNEEEVARISSSKSKSFKQVAFFYFVQYHLHLQLKEAVDYAHKKGLTIKGDIPIGIYRYGADAWTAPELYNMDMQAGAPPDDFAVKGQNWGFPTYNWHKMEGDHFEWWKQRFHQLSNYFDVFRIDHILGFFRIWSVPMDAVEGILGRFIPALPVSVYEFGERGIWFNYDRYCRPFIVDSIIDETFNGHAALVKESFLEKNERGGYDLREEF